MRDLIYFDVPKAASLLSQMEGGLLREMRESDEAAAEARAGLEASIQVLKAHLGGTESGRQTRAETRIMHHDLLNRLEDALFSDGLVVDLNDELPASTSQVGSVREMIGRVPYLRAEGWSSLEDYERLKSRASSLNDILDLVARSARANLEKSEEFQNLRRGLAAQRQVANDEKDRARRRSLLQEVNTAEKQLNAVLEATSGILSDSKLDEWLVEGIQLWVDSFNRDQFHVRVYPFDELPQFHVLANLKRDCFVDPDIEHLLFSYGSRPNVKLTILGLVSSLPALEGLSFHPLREFSDTTELSEQANFERQFRQAFSGLEQFEAYSRFDRYPNVMVLPLALFRSIRA